MSNLPVEYLRAAVRLATGRPCADWTDDEIISSFALIRRPAVSYAEWLAAVSPGEPMTPGVQGSELSDDEMAAHNDANLEDFKATLKGRAE